MTINRIYKEWFEYAEADLDSASYLATMQKPHIEIICYHCQQCAEKILKGFIIYNGIEPKRIHDLTILCRDCENINPSFQMIFEMCEILTEYATNTRYPTKLELEKRDMNEAIKCATDIVEFVKSIIDS